MKEQCFFVQEVKRGRGVADLSRDKTLNNLASYFLCHVVHSIMRRIVWVHRRRRCRHHHHHQSALFSRSHQCDCPPESSVFRQLQSIPVRSRWYGLGLTLSLCSVVEYRIRNWKGWWSDIHMVHLQATLLLTVTRPDSVHSDFGAL